MDTYRVVFNADTIRVFNDWPFPASSYDVLAYDKQDNRVYDNGQERNDDIEYHVKVRASRDNQKNIVKIALLKLDVYLSEESFSNQGDDDLHYQKKIIDMGMDDEWEGMDTAGDEC